MRESTVIKFIEIESRMVVARGWGGGENGNWVSGYRIAVLHNEKVLEIGCTTVEKCLTLLNYTFKND